VIALSHGGNTISHCRLWDSKNPVMDVRQWPLRASRT